MAYRLEQLRQTAHLSEQTHADILDAAEETYDRLRELFPHFFSNEVHRVGLCEPASQLIVAKLCDRGYSAEQRLVARGFFHYYAEIPSERTDDKVLIDPTWQQMLAGELRPDLPKVLIGTPEEAVECARSYGAQRHKLEAYRL